MAGAEAQETGGLQGQTTAWSSPPQALCSGGLQALERDAAPGHPLPPEVGKPILVTSQGAHKVNMPCQHKPPPEPPVPPPLECLAQLSLARVLGSFMGSTGLWVTHWKKWRVRTRNGVLRGVDKERGLVD